MSGLWRLVAQSLRRNLRHNLLASAGVIVGIGAFSFFLALDNGVRAAVYRLFPMNRLEVIPPRSTLLGSLRKLDEGALRALRAPPLRVGVKPVNVFARSTLAFPARGWGGRSIIGRDFYFEVSGFCDGLDPHAMMSEIDAPYSFADRGGPDDVASAPRCGGVKASCPTGRYCAVDVGRCLVPVPTVISPYMIEVYNGTIAKSHPNMPQIPGFIGSILAGRTFTVELGRSYLGGRATQGGASIRRRFQLVGVSDHATPIGLTVPLGYVKRWNRRYAGEASVASYRAAVVVVEDASDLTRMAAYARELGFELAENRGEQIGVFITLITLLFALVSLLIIGIAAINIAHTFMMLIGDRRREIAILRSVGATRSHIRAAILLESGVVGLFSGVVGWLLAVSVAAGVDWYSAHYVADFPFKPDSYFIFTPALASASVGYALLFCLLGAWLPANRAAKLDPAAALSGR